MHLRPEDVQVVGNVTASIVHQPTSQQGGEFDGQLRGVRDQMSSIREYLLAIEDAVKQKADRDAYAALDRRLSALEQRRTCLASRPAASIDTTSAATNRHPAAKRQGSNTHAAAGENGSLSTRRSRATQRGRGDPRDGTVHSPLTDIPKPTKTVCDPLHETQPQGFCSKAFPSPDLDQLHTTSIVSCTSHPSAIISTTPQPAWPLHLAPSRSADRPSSDDSAAPRTPSQSQPHVKADARQQQLQQAYPHASILILGNMPSSQRDRGPPTPPTSSASSPPSVTAEPAVAATDAATALHHHHHYHHKSDRPHSRVARMIEAARRSGRSGA